MLAVGPAVSGRCDRHAYVLDPTLGLRICVRCAVVEPPRGIVTDKHTYEAAMGREPLEPVLPIRAKLSEHERRNRRVLFRGETTLGQLPAWPVSISHWGLH